MVPGLYVETKAASTLRVSSVGRAVRDRQQGSVLALAYGLQVTAIMGLSFQS